MALTGTAGAVQKRYTYDAFGNEASPSSSDPNPFRYCGEFFDKETGSYYLRARYYDPTVGRFTQQDTYKGDYKDPLSLNLYTYCISNPVKYVDSNGHWPTWKQIGIALGITVFTAVFAVAVVASAGSVGVVAAAAVGSLGASGAVMAGASTVAVAGTYALAAGIAVTGGNRALEAVSGRNYLADTVFGGNYEAYSNVEFALAVAGGIAVAAGTTVPAPQVKSQSQTMDPNKIRFSQNSIKGQFSDGTSLNSTIDALKSGTLKPTDLPPIRIFQKDGLLYTLDNRRLYVAQRAGVQVNYVWATNEQVQNEIWKLTTQNNGMSIVVRGK